MKIRHSITKDRNGTVRVCFTRDEILATMFSLNKGNDDNEVKLIITAFLEELEKIVIEEQQSHV